MLKQKLIFFVLGVLIALGVLEFCLGMYAKLQIPKEAQLSSISPSEKKAKIRILCIGDSFTYGLGASSMMSFPEQVKGMFEKDYGTNAVEVINGGVITYNTSQVRKKFEDYLSKSTYDYVVILAGGANEWNFIGNDYYTERYGLSCFAKAFGVARKFIVSTNTYKFLSMIKPKIRDGGSVSLAQETITQPVHETLVENTDLTAENFMKSSGFVSAANGDYQKALKWFKAKVIDDPTNSYHHLGLAYTYYLMKDYRKSEEQVRKGLAIDASNPFLYTALGYIFIEHDKIVEALDMFGRSEDINPGNKYNSAGIDKIVNFTSLDEGLLKGIDNEVSIEVLAKNPKLKSDYIRMISYYESLRNVTKISATYSEYLERFPTNTEAMQRFAQFLLQQREFESAREWYHKAIKLAPKVSNLYTALGQTYLAEEKFDQVLIWYKKAISVDPDNLDNYYKLVELINISQKRSFEIDKDDILAFIEQYIDTSENARSYYGMIGQLWHDDTISEWVATDLFALIQTAKQHAVLPILQSYPYDTDSNAVAEYLAEKNEVIFIDHAESFEKLIQSGTERKQFFAGDGHCNDQGYKIMAKNLYDRIRSDRHFQGKISPNR